MPTSHTIDWNALTNLVRSGALPVRQRLHDSDSLRLVSRLIELFFDETDRCPLWFALSRSREAGAKHEVEHFLNACLEQGASLYDNTGNMLSSVQDPAKLEWWLEQGGDPGALDEEGSPLWFALIDHARFDLLDLLARQPYWTRWASQRNNDGQDTFSRWAELGMMEDEVCYGSNPETPLPLMGEQSPYICEDLVNNFFDEMDTQKPRCAVIGWGSQPRVDRAMAVWSWLYDHRMAHHRERQEWWETLWNTGLSHEPLMLDVWDRLRALHSIHTTTMQRALETFIDAQPQGLRKTLAQQWAVTVESELLKLAAENLQNGPEKVRL